MQDQVAFAHKTEMPLILAENLRLRLKRAGCFAPAPISQIVHMGSVAMLYVGGYALLLSGPALPTRLLALVVLAFCSVQAGFIAHEAGHGAITRRRWLVEIIGQFFLTFLTGLCHSHFQKIHTCHHSRCNERDRDIDMQSEVFSLYPEAVGQKRSTVARFITRHQAFLIWPLVSLQGVTLKMDSIDTLRTDPRSTRIDQVVLVLHFLLWLGPPVLILGLADALLNYALVTWMIGPYLGTIFIVNHVGTRVIEPNERPPRLEQILETTRNLGSSRVADIFFGGLNNHVEHHLFPTIPSARLPAARAIVRSYCHAHDLPYRETSWLAAVKEVSVYLGQVARTANPRVAVRSGELSQ